MQIAPQHSKFWKALIVALWLLHGNSCVCTNDSYCPLFSLSCYSVTNWNNKKQNNSDWHGGNCGRLYKGAEYRRRWVKICYRWLTGPLDYLYSSCDVAQYGVEKSSIGLRCIRSAKYCSKKWKVKPTTSHLLKCIFRGFLSHHFKPKVLSRQLTTPGKECYQTKMSILGFHKHSIWDFQLMHI